MKNGERITGLIFLIIWIAIILTVITVPKTDTIDFNCEEVYVIESNSIPFINDDIVSTIDVSHDIVSILDIGVIFDDISRLDIYDGYIVLYRDNDFIITNSSYEILDGIAG